MWNGTGFKARKRMRELKQSRPPTEQHPFRPVPLDPPLQGGPVDRIHLAATDDLESRLKSWEGQAGLRLRLGMRDVKVRRIVGARRDDIQAMPASGRIRNG